MSQNEKFLGLAVILFFGLLFMLKKSRQAPTVSEPQHSSSPIAAAPNLTMTPAPPPTAIPAAIPAASPKTAVAVKEKKLGLCQYMNDSSPDGMMTLHAFRHLRTGNAPQYLALPSIHAACLKTKDEWQLKLVQYSSNVDRAFDYKGSYNVRLTYKSEFRTSDEFLTAAHKELKSFGFQTESELFQFLVDEGAEVDQPVTVFEVSALRNIRTRPSAAAYDFFPGVRIASLTELKGDMNSGRLQIVDLRAAPVPVEGMEKAHSLNLPSLVGRPLLNPSALENTQKEISNLHLEMSKPVLLVGLSAADRTPFNALQGFLSSGFTDIIILKDGASEFNHLKLWTPLMVPGITTSTLRKLIAHLDDSILIDTRLSTEVDSVSLPNAWSAPVLIDAKNLSLYQDLDAFHEKQVLPSKYDLSSRIDFPMVVEKSHSKKIFLIGRDEYDWGPLILFASLRKYRTSGIYWLRGGFSQISLADELGILNPKVEKDLSHATAYKPLESKVQISKGQPVKMVTVGKETTASAQKSFRYRVKRTAPPKAR